MKKIPFYMRQQFIARNYEVVKSSSNAWCVMRQVSYVRCVDTYVPRLDMLIFLVDMIFHTLSIQYFVCSHC